MLYKKFLYGLDLAYFWDQAPPKFFLWDSNILVCIILKFEEGYWLIQTIRLIEQRLPLWGCQYLSCMWDLGWTDDRSESSLIQTEKFSLLLSVCQQLSSTAVNATGTGYVQSLV